MVWFLEFPGFKTLCKDARVRCAERNGNVIKDSIITWGASVETCLSKCSSESTCEYFFLSQGGYCALYKSCSDRLVPQYPGTIYQKLHEGNYIQLCQEK
jgi:hypothetical protein